MPKSDFLLDNPIIAEIIVKKRLARQAQVQQTETWESKRTIWLM